MLTRLYPVPWGSSRNHRVVSEQRLVAVNVSNPPFLGLTPSLISDGVRSPWQRTAVEGLGLGEIPGWMETLAGRMERTPRWADG